MPLYEEDIKEFILTKPHMFGELGDNVVLFEKALSFKRDGTIKKTIADALIFSTIKGLIGVEIKTEGDTTKRIKRQLAGYSLSCNFVYVACHDKHVEEIERIIKRYGYQHVGIIAYSEFKGKIYGGIYREAYNSPEKSTFHQLNMLWKKEIMELLNAQRHVSRYQFREDHPQFQGRKVPMLGTNSSNYTEMGATYKNRLGKTQLINELINRYGEDECTRLLCQIFINNRQNVERVLTIKHFQLPPKKDDEHE